MRLTLGVVLGGAFTFLLAISAPLPGAGLRAGAAKAVITPDVKAGKVYMAGFGLPRVSTTISMSAAWRSRRMTTPWPCARWI